MSDVHEQGMCVFLMMYWAFRITCSNIFGSSYIFVQTGLSFDEHPFVGKDFELLKNKFKKVEIKYYGFLTLVFFPFYLNPQKSIIFKILKTTDQILFKLKFFRYFAWSVLISAKK